MMETNYKTVCSLNGKDVPMDFNCKEKINEILLNVGMSDYRACKMDNVDFLKLLLAFQENGFRFSK